MSTSNSAMTQEVHSLHREVLQLVRKASAPEVALNVLLMAYLKQLSAAPPAMAAPRPAVPAPMPGMSPTVRAMRAAIEAKKGRS